MFGRRRQRADDGRRASARSCCAACDRAGPGQCLDPPDTRRDAALLDDDEEPDVAGRARRACRRTAPMLNPGDRDDAHAGRRTFRRRAPSRRWRSPLRWTAPRSDRRVAVDLFVDDPLDLVELLARDRREVDEVESQPVGRRRASPPASRACRGPAAARRGAGESRCDCAASRRAARSSTSAVTTWPRPERSRRSTRTRCRRGRLGACRITPLDDSFCAIRPLTMRPVSETWPPDST